MRCGQAAALAGVLACVLTAPVARAQDVPATSAIDSALQASQQTGLPILAVAGSKT
jgi:hypothetical protein